MFNWLIKEIDPSAFYDFYQILFLIRSSYKPSVVCKSGVKMVNAAAL